MSFLEFTNKPKAITERFKKSIHNVVKSVDKVIENS